MLINIKKTMTILSTLLLGIMCSFCSDTIDVYAGQYGCLLYTSDAADEL